MVEMKQLVILLLAVGLCFSARAFADTITLKSGQKIEGEILEKTDAGIKIEWNGIGVFYSADEVESVNNVKLISPILNSTGEYYNYKEYGIRIWHPIDWEVFDRTQHPEVFKTFLATMPDDRAINLICALSSTRDWGNFDSFILVVAQGIPDNLNNVSAEDLVKLTIQNTPPLSQYFNILNYIIDDDPQVEVINGRKMMAYQGTKMVQGKEWQSGTYAFVKGKILYVIVGVTAPILVDSRSEAFENIARKLEVE